MKRNLFVVMVLIALCLSIVSCAARTEKQD